MELFGKGTRFSAHVCFREAGNIINSVSCVMTWTFRSIEFGMDSDEMLP